MYLRHTTICRDGKTHTYWRLVRSVRHGRKVVQETVAHLGELDGQGRARARRLALQITGDREQYDLFEAAVGAGEPVAVRLDEVRLERARRFGDVWLGWRLWCALGLDRFCAAQLTQGRELVPWAAMAAILVIARLCEPSSELHIAQDWYRRTALADLLGVAAERVNDDRLYRALDRLLPHKRALEGHLKGRLGELFGLDYELLLYDVTSTYFEGQAAANPLAQRGHSRDHRGDCKQVCIGLVVTREGIPLGYEVFAGNRTDVTTVEEIVGTMERRYGQARRVWVMDRGMTSAETVTFLQSTQRHYLIGASKSELKKLTPQLADARDWRQVRDGVEAKLCAGPDGNETFLLVRSADRQHKERAMHARFCERIETALARLQERLTRARSPVDRGTTERQIGRLLGRNSRAAARYVVSLIADPAMPAGAAACLVGAPGMGRVVPPQRRLLRAAHQHHRLDARDAVANLHSAHRSRSRFPHSQKRTLDPARLASARGPRARPYFGVLSRLRAVENTGAMAKPRRPRQQPAHYPPGTRRHPQHRHRPAHRDRAATRTAPALCRAPGPRPGSLARSPRTALARKVTHAIRLTPNTQCSANSAA